MSNPSARETGSPALRPLLPLLLVLCFGSGCAALIYEIVWFQMLQMVIGSTAVSLGALLGTYMGGMCLGAFLFPRLASGRWHPLRVYAWLELGIGLIGILIFFGLPKAAWVYSAHVGSGFPAILLRGLFAATCLLPPTILMGATLPAIARWVESAPRGISWLGFFYGGNIAGATFGCLLAGFYLLRVYDSFVATLVAALLNGTVALVAFVVSTSARCEKKEPADEVVPPGKLWDHSRGNRKLGRVNLELGSRMAYVAIALSGMTAIGAEVVWTRLLSLALGGTVYAFSIILAVFLFGLGAGAGAGSMLARRSLRPGILLGWCQLLLTAAIAWTAYMLTKSLPYWPVEPLLAENPWRHFRLEWASCLMVLLPPTVLWGASFPLALAAVTARGRDAGRLVGDIYAANTVGGILGGVGFSVFFIPLAGTQQSQRLLIGLAALAAFLMLVAPTLNFRRLPSSATVLRGGAIGAAMILIFFLLASVVAPIPGELVAYGRRTASRLGEAEILYVGEGMNSSVAVSRLWESDVRNFHVSGKIEASNEPQDMRLQRMLGQIPAMIHPRPGSVLVVGCGAGVTAGALTVHPGVTNITLCEIEPLVPQIASKYFSVENFNVVNDPRTTIIYDDARNYILTTHEKFDIITSDPIHPWVKGSATLYTQEYFELVKSHLNPGGIVTQWVPLYESDLSAVKSEIATFFEVFPDGIIWANNKNGKGYDLVLFGQLGETRINLDEIEQRLTQPEFSAMRRSLEQVGFPSTSEVFATYVGRARDLTVWLADAQINRDNNLRLQYLAGLHSDRYDNDGIYQNMVAWRQFPAGLFAGADESMAAFKQALASTGMK
ncbi:MAG: fused MFS/spermidine synthase [Limisphaerales bacterium]